MKLRTGFILEALHMGYDVLLTDVDVIYLKNPFDYLNHTHKFDISPLQEIEGGATFNAGFLYIKATTASISLYQQMDRIAIKYTALGEQVRFNQAINKMTMGLTNHTLRVNPLPVQQFQSGYTFWLEANRHFATDRHCTECVVVHNNFIIGHDAKLWRMKEMHMWMHNKDGYYSSTHSKYLTYRNPVWFGSQKATTMQEMRAAANAVLLGIILDRLVLMPRFHGETIDDWVPLQGVVKVDSMDPMVKSRIRESTFLLHPKVPAKINRTQWMWS